MNISKTHMELLIQSHIAQRIKIERNENGQTYFGELLVNLHEESKRIDVHFIYYTETKALIAGGYDEVIEFTLTDKTENTKEYLQKLEDKIYVDKNALYYIIQILKEM